MKRLGKTGKNGVFTPRIQSILALFLMILWRENNCVSGESV
jgi:hypothetical protein